MDKKMIQKHSYLLHWLIDTKSCKPFVAWMCVLKKIMEKVFEISSSGKNKDKLKRYEEVWSKIKDFIISINDNSDVVTYL